MAFIINNWLLFLALAVVLYLLFGAPLRRRMLGIVTVNNTQAIQLINHERGVLVDVREDSEFKAGHVPKAIHLPLGQVLAGATLDKYKERPVVLCCRTSQRSSTAAVRLSKAGYKRVHVLEGGFTGWENEKLPVEK